MRPIPKRHVAASFLPSRYHHVYALCKLASDPLYQAACIEFQRRSVPLLDVGCGIGLLLQCLRATGATASYLGIDSDSAKLNVARTAAARRELKSSRFEHCDLNVGFPEHEGDVALLDVLQYLSPESRHEVLAGAARSLGKHGKLVMRVGIADKSWRAAFTRSSDRFGHRAQWMKMALHSQPTREELATVLSQHDLTAELQPLWGRTPFNNYLVVARHG